MRGRNHAAEKYTSQFINALFREATAIWRSWSATDEHALKALLSMAQGTLGSIASAGIFGGMPGPVSRGNVSSVEKHVAALCQLGEGTISFYRQLCASTAVGAGKRRDRRSAGAAGIGRAGNGSGA